MLDQKLDGQIKISSDLLDVSEYSLNQCSSVVNKLTNFQTNEVFVSSIENIQTTIPRSNCYDIIWAIHSLYTVEINSIKDVIKQIRELLKPGGIFLIYQASLDSSYSQLYDFYLRNCEQPNNNTKYLIAEDIQETLDILRFHYDLKEFNYDHEIDHEDQDLLAVYLKKCVLDNSVDVVSLFKEKISDSFRSQNNKFIFKQKTKLIVFQK